MTQEEMEQVVHFDSADWTLFKVEVRLDTGKFICSTWYRWIGEKCFFVDIGFGDKIERIQWARSDYIDDIRMWCDNDNKEASVIINGLIGHFLIDDSPYTCDTAYYCKSKGVDQNKTEIYIVDDEHDIDLLFLIRDIRRDDTSDGGVTKL